MRHAYRRPHPLLLPESRLGTRMADGARPKSSSSTTLARPAPGCSTAGTARPGTPSSRGRPSSTPGCPTTRPWRSWSTSPRAAACDRPPEWSGSTRTRSRGWPCWPAGPPRPPTTSWWPFLPETREVQLDEKWAFVAKKQRNCDPADPDDDHCGDYWDYVALDAEHKLVLAVIPGARREENARAIVAQVKRRVGCEPPLMTSDEYPAYATAIEEVFSEPTPAPPHRKPGRPRVAPERRLPHDLIYAMVHKHREDNRVIALEQRHDRSRLVVEGMVQPASRSVSVGDHPVE